MNRILGGIDFDFSRKHFMDRIWGKIERERERFTISLYFKYYYYYIRIRIIIFVESSDYSSRFYIIVRYWIDRLL